MLGETGGTNQSKVLTNNFSELLIALLFLVLASLLKPRGGKERWRFDSGQALLFARVAWSRDAARRSPGESPNSPGELPVHRPGEASVWLLISEVTMLKWDMYMHMNFLWTWAVACWPILHLGVNSEKRASFSGQKQTPHCSSWFGEPLLSSLPGHSTPVLWTTCTTTWGGPEYELGRVLWSLQQNGFAYVKKLGLIF